MNRPHRSSEDMSSWMTALESRRTWILALALAALLAGGLRMSMWRTCFPPGGGFVFVDTDSYYHLRRAESIARSYPTIPWEDPYLYYPDRGLIPWAGGYDLLLGTLLSGLDVLGLEGDRREAVLAAFNPLVSVATALAIAALAALLFGRFTALLSILVFAVLPGHVAYSRYGNIDHHAINALLILVLLWLAAAALRHPERRVPALVFGLLLGVAHTIHASFSQLTLGLMALNVVYFFWSARFDPSGRAVRLKCFRDLFFWSSLSIGGFFWTIPWELASAVHMWILSLFHVVLALLVLTASEILRSLACRPTSRLIRMRVVLLVAGALALIWSSDFWPGLRDGLRVSLGDHWFLGISGESRPLWHYGFGMLPRLLSPLLFIAPLVAGASLVRSLRRADIRRTICLALIGGYGTMAMLLGVGNTVFVANAALFVALFGGAGLAWAAHWTARFLERRRSVRVPSYLCRGVCAAGLFVLMTGPVYSEMASFSDRSRYKLRQYWAMDALGRFLRENTAPVGDYLDPGATPDYSVVANRDLGHFINVRGRRPAVQNPFGEPHYYIEHNRRFARLELSTDPVAAREILAGFGAGYYLSRPLAISEINYLAGIGGLDAQEYVTQGGESTVLRPAFYSSFNNHMVMFDGAAVSGPSVPALGGRSLEAITFLRLVYESECAISDGRRAYSTFKLFQIVSGARLIGPAMPGQAVRLSLKLQTNTGRTFLYRDQTRADRQGRFELTIPYSSEREPGIDVYALGPVVLNVGGRAYTIPVTARAVREGQPVRIEFPEPD